MLAANGDGRDGDPEEIRDILSRSGAVDYALGVARARAARAAAALESLRDSPARRSLAALVEFVTARTS